MIYDVIIIGAGAAGLFAGAVHKEPVRGLIIEKTGAPGNKLILSGSGQCNLSRGGSIKDFVDHYGDNGRRIRHALYKFSNLAVADFFRNNGVELTEREDGKLFPASLDAREIRDLLVRKCGDNGFAFSFDTPVDRIAISEENTKGQRSFIVTSEGRTFKCRKLIIACGGCSYPATGSDGSIFAVLRDLQIDIVDPRPALTPVHVHDYPYEALSGISFPGARIAVLAQQDRAASSERRHHRSIISETIDDLLLTHRNFSGPAILNISRHAEAGRFLQICYYTQRDPKTILLGFKNRVPGCQQQLLAFLCDYLELPRRFLETICLRAKVDPAQKAVQTSDRQFKSIIGLLTADTCKISGIAGFNIAMATAGGVSLAEVDPKTMESLKYPGLFFAGEVLDIDGDCGGYNLQFAFSSASLCAAASR